MTHGWILVDKPEGISSAHTVAKIKRLFNVKKAGHGGTLDPLATGVLPIALGEATKTLSYVLNGKKAYRFEVKWGEDRSTGDREGDIIATSGKRPTSQEITQVLPKFIGTIDQMPPAFSALKIQGQRAYALARKGIKVKLNSRCVEIKSLILRNSTSEAATFEVVCSKGTYVRSLGQDLALSLGTYGHLISLRRLMAGPFHEKDAILLDSLLKIGHKTELMKYVLPLQDALADILALEVDSIEATKIHHGQAIPSSYEEEKEVVLIMCEGVPQALAKIKERSIMPFRVFNIDER